MIVFALDSTNAVCTHPDADDVHNPGDDEAGIPLPFLICDAREHIPDFVHTTPLIV